jgi:hypothetical protein
MILWESLMELKEVPGFKLNLEIKHQTVSQEVLDTIKANNLDSYLVIWDMFLIVKLAHQRKSQVLLLIEVIQRTLNIIPGKLFEYMVSTDHCYWSKDSDFAEIIKTTNTGEF